MKIVFLLSHIPNPRMNKRIAVAKRVGEVQVICVRRASQNVLEAEHKDVSHEEIHVDLPPSSRIVRRYIVTQQYCRQAIAKLRRMSPDIIYTGGQDSLDIAVRYKKAHLACRIFYEVADLRESYIEKPKSIVKRLVNIAIKAKERALLQYVDQLIVTSQKFYDAYYYKYIPSQRTLFIPNTPSFEVFDSYKKKSEGVFTIGFIGIPRYLGQMRMLVDVAGKIGCKVIFSGGGGISRDLQSFYDYCNGLDYVTFTGAYSYTQDIASLYGAVDCVYSVYDSSNANVRIALPNKLYESVYCQLPLIVARGTYLSEVVEEWGVGVSVAHNNPEELAETLQRLRDDATLRECIANHCSAQVEKICGDSYNRALEELLLQVAR